MLRFTVRLNDDRDNVAACAQTLLHLVSNEVRVIAVFVEAKSVEAYVEIAEQAEPRAIDRLAARFGFDDYEVTDVESLPVSAEPRAGFEIDPPRWRASPATITLVAVEPDGRTLNIRVRHRRHETIRGVNIDETNEDVRVNVLVGIPPDDPHAAYVSFAVVFSPVRARLARPLGNRHLVWSDTTPVPRLEVQPPPTDSDMPAGQSPALVPMPVAKKVWCAWGV